MDETSKKHLLKFIRSQKVLTIASVGEGKPWISNVYFSVDDDFNFFFVSPDKTMHSKQILQYPDVAFTIVWHNEDNLTDRKAIQATGKCTKIQEPKTIIKFLKNHHKSYPIWKNRITLINMRDKIIESRPYVIKPSFIKLWDDELLGENGTKEFNL